MRLAVIYTIITCGAKEKALMKEQRWMIRHEESIRTGRISFTRLSPLFVSPLVVDVAVPAGVFPEERESSP